MKSEAERALDQLPVLNPGDICQKCGANRHTDSISYNIDEHGNITDCSKCKERMQ